MNRKDLITNDNTIKYEKQYQNFYSNALTDKAKILSDNKGKAGIYLWTHKESDKEYVGSSVDLTKRFKDYYSSYQLKKWDNYISRALTLYGYSAFTLTILEYIDISNLSKDEARKLILEREQYYLDTIFLLDEPNTYNILQVAGSRLGAQHSEETKALLSEIHKGKVVSPETKALMSKALKGRTFSAESLAKMSLAKTGENNHFYGETHTAETKAKQREANLGKFVSAETKTKMSSAQGTAIFVYSEDGILKNTFTSAKEAGKHFNCCNKTIKKYAISGKLFQEQWILSLSAK